MMPAGKHFDPVLGVDIHIIQPPGPVPPLPVPHPFVGFLIDPMDYVPILGGTVEVNGMKRGVAGTAGKCVPPHIPIGGVFVKPPANECEVFMGSMTVAFDGDPATRMAEPVLSCHDIGMPPIPRFKRGGKVKSMVLPTSVLLPIPAGPPVLIGGPPTISLMAMGMKLGMAALGKALGKLRKLQKASKRWAAISKKMRDAANKVLDKVPGGDRIRNAVSKGICSLTGHPVDVATGKVLTDAVDFELPGPLPLRWERTWYSTSTYQGPLGHGWHHSYDLSLKVYPEGVLVRLSDGRFAGFAHPEPDAPSWNPREKASLHIVNHEYVLRASFGLEYHFHRDKSGGQELPLRLVADLNGNTIQFLHKDGRLTRIIDSAGRELLVATDSLNRIARIDAPAPNQPDEYVPLVSYTYDQHGDLEEVRDPHGQPFRFAYKNHLLTQESDRQGVSFYFEWDGTNEDARCVRTWGDGGIFARELKYDLKQQQTRVVDSLGQTTLYGWNAQGVVTRMVDPTGGEHLTEWDADGNKLSETNPCGETWSYDYDEEGRLIAATNPLGQTTTVEHDEAGNVVAVTDAGGAVQRREYDARRNLTAIIDPMGNREEYVVDPRGRLVRARDPLGRVAQFRYTAHGNLMELIDQAGARTTFEHDAWGRMIERRDPLGGVTRWVWDLNSRPTRILYPGEGPSHYTYDGAGNLIEAADALGRTTRFRYAPRGQLAEIHHPSGKVQAYHYDTELRLIEARDNQGTVGKWIRDGNGKIVEEQTGDGRRITFTLDKVGRPVASVLNGRKRTEFERDPLGRVVLKRYADGLEDTFKYNAQDRLVKAANASATLEWVYDRAGRVLVERCNDEAVLSKYDTAGNRVQRISPLGHSLTFRYDAEDQLSAVADRTGDIVSLSYDCHGREVLRAGRGDLQRRREYNGEDTLREILTRRGTELAQRWYRFDPADQLAEAQESSLGVTRFRHDPDGRLLETIYPDQTRETYAYDPSGNVLAAPVGIPPSNGERMVGAGGWRLVYDDEGNLVEKRGDSVSWRYKYNGVGQLVEARRTAADASATPHFSKHRSASETGELIVEFQYDPLGRRIRKKVRPAAGTPYEVDYLWDGDTQMGERRRDLVPVTPRISAREYFCPTDRFEPLVQLGTDGASLFDCDYLGRPRSLFDSQGQQIWGADYRAFGTIHQETGLAGSVPFRFAGQVADPETGLCYNRFRYYDPELRSFTSPDPLGLAGGSQLWNYVPSPMNWIDPYGLSSCPATMNPKEIHWTQNSCSNKTMDGKYTVVQNIKDLKSGKVKPDDIPPIRVYRDADGKVWSLDNRRLASFRGAGDSVKEVPVKWVDPKDPDVAKEIGQKMSTTTGGKTIDVKMGDPRGSKRTIR